MKLDILKVGTRQWRIPSHIRVETILNSGTLISDKNKNVVHFPNALELFVNQVQTNGITRLEPVSADSNAPVNTSIWS